MPKIKIKKKLRIDPSLNLSSMTDIIFLLLIFFLLTSNFRSINGMNLSLPESTHVNEIKSQITVTILNQNEFLFKDQQLSLLELSEKLKIEIDYLKKQLKNNHPSVVIQANKELPIKTLVEVADIAQSNDAKISISTINKSQS